ncbi:hypothetical protein FOPG_19343 [Fusarium oxysporum f. sp. conglutinans race 2 54008]|uniref:Uncharacterized protein n=1 Tax=Fusarium oxysporum f. sp. conglutinans race 2 54008 TaxID=1089457 RepID=X0GLC7_FUSOX|nr:hypothetical protein FOPG_19343 [Fusarium oxysporum f. sp. conglutinans race 2 54008]
MSKHMPFTNSSAIISRDTQSYHIHGVRAKLHFKTCKVRIPTTKKNKASRKLNMLVRKRNVSS